MTFGRNKSEFKWADRKALTFDEFASVLTAPEVGAKDGTCYTPAIFSGTRRLKDQATRIDIAVLDADCGHDFEEVCGAVRQQGWRAIVHSTFSHLTDQTIIAAQACDKWMDENVGASVADYMLAKKGYLPRVSAGAKVIDEVTDGGTRSYVIQHQPCPKFRIVLPLQEAWLSSDFDSQDLANAMWRERIGALAFALGLHHDQSCVDTSRLFYFPRIRAGQQFLQAVIAGEDCPIWTLPDAAWQGQSASLFDQPQEPRAQTAHLEYRAPDGAAIDLTSWAAQYASRFEVVKALRARAPHLLGQRVSGVKQHMMCPNAESHVTDATDKTGTYAVNASQLDRAQLGSIKSGFVLHCMHGGCAGQDRLGHLRKLLCTGDLLIADLTSPLFLTPDVPQIDPSALIDGTAIHNETVENAGNVPQELYTNLPSVMQEMHAYLCATSTKPQPILNLGATLAFMAAAVGRKVKLQHWGVRPNVYVVGIAHSGAGKERALSGIKDMARAAGLFDKLIGVEEVASDSGIITSVMAQPNQIMVLDEVGFLIGATNSAKSSPHLVNVISTLLKLYSSSHTVFKGKSYANTEVNKTKIIDQPCVSLYGCTTPRGLFSALTSRDVSSGLLSRVVLFDVGDTDPRGKPPAPMPVPAVIVDWLRAWDAVSPVPNPVKREGGEPVLEPRIVMMTQEAMDLCEAFEDEMHAAKIAARERGTDALYVRARENALKFALIRACCPPPAKSDTGPTIDESNLKVDAETMRWAISLSRVTVHAMERGAREEIADTAFELKAKNLRTLILRAGSKGLTLWEMGRASAGRLPQRERDDVLRLLRESGDIFYVENVNEGKRGIKRSAYVSKAFVRFHPETEGEAA